MCRFCCLTQKPENFVAKHCVAVTGHHVVGINRHEMAVAERGQELIHTILSSQVTLSPTQHQARHVEQLGTGQVSIPATIQVGLEHFSIVQAVICHHELCSTHSHQCSGQEPRLRWCTSNKHWQTLRTLSMTKFGSQCHLHLPSGVGRTTFRSDLSLSGSSDLLLLWD